VATFLLYKESVSSQNDISSLIYDLSAFAYKINDDWTFELPEVQFSSTLYITPGTWIIIAETGYTSLKQIVFYVKKLTWDSKRKMYDYTCPHILEQLADIPVRNFANDGASWSDIALAYNQWNFQLGAWETQGQEVVWERCLVSALIAIKMMIYRITGTSVGDIDSSKIDDEASLYYWRDNGTGPWVTTPITYAELGLNLNCLQRMGSEDHTVFAETEFIKVYKMTSCLEALRYICSALMVTIDIFRADYVIDAFAVSAAPTQANTLDLTQTALEPPRLAEITTQRLTGGSFEWRFGYWDAEGDYVPYTYGVDSPDRTIVEHQVADENTGVANIKALSIRYPNFFRIFQIAGTNYQAATVVILNGEDGTHEQEQYLAALRAFWDVSYSRNKYEIASPGLELRVPYVEHDLAARRMKYEVIT